MIAPFFHITLFILIYSFIFYNLSGSCKRRIICWSISSLTSDLRLCGGAPKPKFLQPRPLWLSPEFLSVCLYLSLGRIYAAPESRHRHAMPVCPSSRRNRGSSPRRRETNRRTWAPVVRAEGDDKCTGSAEDGTLVKETLKCSHLTNKRCMAYTRRLHLKEGGRHTTSTASLQAFQ